MQDPSVWSGYNLIRNNCETFATWLKTGRKISAQAIEAVEKGASSASAAVTGSILLGVALVKASK